MIIGDARTALIIFRDQLALEFLAAEAWGQFMYRLMYCRRGCAAFFSSGVSVRPPQQLQDRILPMDTKELIRDIVVVLPFPAIA